MAVVCVTACPSSMTFVTGVAARGCRATPWQLVWATRPPPKPEPMAPSPEASPAPKTAAQVGDTGLAEKSVQGVRVLTDDQGSEKVYVFLVGKIRKRLE